MIIGLDLMGGDTPPKDLFEAIKQFRPFAFSLKIFSTENFVPSDSEGLKWVPCGPSIDMTDAPLSALRLKKTSSMVCGVEALNRGEIDAFVSTGNTGALIGLAALRMKKMPGVRRPALLASVPSKSGPVAVLDVGGLVSAKAEYVVQFAHMGAAYQRVMRGIDCPRVGLLNIGQEAQKGGRQLRGIFDALCVQSGRGFSFTGNVEGRDVFQGEVDVLVTEGFSGNVFLKSAEGISHYILEYLESRVPDISAVRDVRRQVDHAEHPGALVVGVEGTLIKCHGNACGRALLSGILGAERLLRLKLVDRLRSYCG